MSAAVDKSLSLAEWKRAYQDALGSQGVWEQGELLNRKRVVTLLQCCPATADPKRVQGCNNPLAICAMSGNGAAIKILLELGANPNLDIGYNSFFSHPFFPAFTPLTCARNAEITAIRALNRLEKKPLSENPEVNQKMRTTYEEVLRETKEAIQALERAGALDYTYVKMAEDHPREILPTLL